MVKSLVFYLWLVSREELHVSGSLQDAIFVLMSSRIDNLIEEIKVRRWLECNVCSKNKTCWVLIIGLYHFNRIAATMKKIYISYSFCHCEKFLIKRGSLSGFIKMCYDTCSVHHCVWNHLVFNRNTSCNNITWWKITASPHPTKHDIKRKQSVTTSFFSRQTTIQLVMKRVILMRFYGIIK